MGAGSLDGLAAWMLMAMMMRVGMRMLMNDDKDEDWKDVSHARRQDGSADYCTHIAALHVLCIMSIYGSFTWT